MVAVFLQQLGPCIIYIQISADILVPILCEANPWVGYEEAQDDCNADAHLRRTLQVMTRQDGPSWTLRSPTHTI
jgi:hypothetical protein